jgi:hypothetical protein
MTQLSRVDLRSADAWASLARSSGREGTGNADAAAFDRRLSGDRSPADLAPEALA